MVVEAVRGLHEGATPHTTLASTLDTPTDDWPYTDKMKLMLLVAMEANNVMASISISVLILTTLFCTTTLADWNTKQPPSSGKIYINFADFLFFYEILLARFSSLPCCWLIIQYRVKIRSFFCPQNQFELI